MWQLYDRWLSVLTDDHMTAIGNPNGAEDGNDNTRLAETLREASCHGHLAEAYPTLQSFAIGSDACQAFLHCRDWKLTLTAQASSSSSQSQYGRLPHLARIELLKCLLQVPSKVLPHHAILTYTCSQGHSLVRVRLHWLESIHHALDSKAQRRPYCAGGAFSYQNGMGLPSQIAGRIMVPRHEGRAIAITGEAWHGGD